jgi:hypothetical protein
LSTTKKPRSRGCGGPDRPPRQPVMIVNRSRGDPGRSLTPHPPRFDRGRVQVPCTACATSGPTPASARSPLPRRPEPGQRAEPPQEGLLLAGPTPARRPASATRASPAAGGEADRGAVRLVADVLQHEQRLEPRQIISIRPVRSRLLEASPGRCAGSQPSSASTAVACASCPSRRRRSGPAGRRSDASARPADAAARPPGA